MDIAAERFAVDLARRAGDVMRDNFTLGAKKDMKSDYTPVTATDLAINEMVIEAVKESYPHMAVIGEEQSFGDATDVEWTWVCDPVDGTIPFSMGMPNFTFSLGLAHRGESVLGVLYDPMSNRLMVARKGEGARLNGELVQVSDTKSLKGAVVDVEGPYGDLDGGLFRRTLREAGGFSMTLCSVAYAGLLTACGEFAAAIYGATFPWDGCALDIIIKEAGGRMTDIEGNAIKWNAPINGFVASNGVVHDDLLTMLAADYATKPR